MNDKNMLFVLLAFLVSGAVSYLTTRPVMALAHKIGAVDVPKDNRRMHDHPIPRIGGLAIFLGFLVSYLIFGTLDVETRAILMGAVILICLGVVDDIVALSAKIKLVVQIIAAAIPACCGVAIEFFNNPFGGTDSYFHLGILAVPVTIIWIVGIANAVNLIDGLDGLAVGISSIASMVMLAIALLVSEHYVAIAMAALLGACLGFLPFNFNPARIFMGDTGALFLGYILATMSIQGFFKFYAIISFAVPFLILGLPIFDTAFAIVRRVSHGQSPFHADRGHVHHRLIDMGFDQKQAVTILYAISAVLGLMAVILATSGESKIVFLAIAAIFSFYISMNVRKMGKTQQDKTKGEDKHE